MNRVKADQETKLCAHCGERRSAKNVALCASCALDAISDPLPIIDEEFTVEPYSEFDDVWEPLGDEDPGFEEDYRDDPYEANLAEPYSEIFGT